MNEDLARLRAENDRVRREEVGKFAILQRQRGEDARRRREEERIRTERLLQEQELERQRLLKMQREAQERRDREMRELEQQMRRTRIEEAEKREKERREAQKKLDYQQIGLDYRKLCRAREYGLLKSGVASWLKICNHCFCILENKSYVGEHTFHLLYHQPALAIMLHY
jgi:hypothetical protein